MAPTPLPPRMHERHTLVDTWSDDPKKWLPAREYVNKKPVWYERGARGRCLCCQALAKREGNTVATHSGRNEKQHCERHLPNATDLPAHWSHIKSSQPVPKVSTACAECSRRLKQAAWLCKGCHDSWSEEERCWMCWDHDMVRPAQDTVDAGIGGGS